MDLVGQYTAALVFFFFFEFAFRHFSAVYFLNTCGTKKPSHPLPSSFLPSLIPFFPVCLRKHAYCNYSCDMNESPQREKYL